MPRPQPERADHYFTAEPGAASDEREVELVLAEGRLLRLTTDRGTFSPDRVDEGTRALLAEGPPASGARTLVDLGCGYGPIAIALALRADPGATVWAVEVNERARDLCARNAEAAGVASTVRVVGPDDVPADLAIDELWSNPPIRIGKAALHELLQTWLGRLAPDGRAHLVVQRHLGADSLARWLDEQGWPTARRATRGAYRILDVEARP